jgi:hypothetical protein
MQHFHKRYHVYVNIHDIDREMNHAKVSVVQRHRAVDLV